MELPDEPLSRVLSFLGATDCSVSASVCQRLQQGLFAHTLFVTSCLDELSSGAGGSCRVRCSPHVTIADLKVRIEATDARFKMSQRNLRLGDSLVKMLDLNRTLKDYMQAEGERLDPDPHERSAGLLTLLSCEMIFQMSSADEIEEEFANSNTYCPPLTTWSHVSQVEDAFTELALERHESQ
jgi:hypothetical protein